MLPCEWVFNFAATCVKIRAARNAKKYIAIILTDTAIAIWSAIVIFAFHFHWKKMKMMWFLPKQACSLTCRTWFVGWGISTEPQCFIYSSVLWHISAFSLKKCSSYLDIALGHFAILIFQLIMQLQSQWGKRWHWATWQRHILPAGYKYVAVRFPFLLCSPVSGCKNNFIWQCSSTKWKK